MRYATTALSACGIALCFLIPVAQAGDVGVNCQSHGAKGQIGKVLNGLDPAATNVVHVSGHCHENLVIQGFDRLSLIAEHGAAIEDASSGRLPVVHVKDSQRVVIQGFTIQGGSNGVLCEEASYCRLTGDTIQDTQHQPGVNAGIVIYQSDAELTNVVVRNVVDSGIDLWGAKVVVSNVSISGVANTGVWPNGAGITMSVSSLRDGPITVQDADGDAVLAINNSTLDVNTLTATDNGAGVDLETGSVGNFYAQLTVQHNKGHGVIANTGSAVQISGTNTISDNQGVGIYALVGSSASFGGTSVISNNQSFSGILVQSGSVASMWGTATISNHPGPGIFVQWGSRFSNWGNLTVTNNQFGLYATDVSLAVLGGGTFSGNVITDISCDGPPPATVLLLADLGSFTTDCTFPASASAKAPKGLTVPTPPVSPPR